MQNLDAPQHGGRLHAAADLFSIPLAQWLDLSTGINPYSWQPPDIPLSVWQRLPDSYAELESAAHHYYGAEVLSIPGSQWAIQTLPSLFPQARTWIPSEGYEEHRYWWQKLGHEIRLYDDLSSLPLQKHDVVVVINPNNPTTNRYERDELIALADTLNILQGTLLVDEAFMDATPEASVFAGNSTLPANLIVLRSMGKFFGLAGMRLGFIYCNEHLQQTLRSVLGPWAVSHPAAYVASLALQDTHWQQQNRLRLAQSSIKLKAILLEHFDQHSISCDTLFCTLQLESNKAAQLYNHCAQQGVLLRLFEQWGKIRIGLTTKPGLQRLQSALQCWNS